MGRSPCSSSIDSAINRGAWTAKEDMILREYITNHGEERWSSIPIKAGLNRSGKSCRLRWMNYLRPDIKRGNISADEEELIIRLHGLLGNRWSLIAGRLPGRTDNEIKNCWNTKLSKKCLPYNQPPSSPSKKLNIAPPGDHHILKSAPVKAKAVRLSRCCNRYGGSSVSDHQDLNSPAGVKNIKNFKMLSEEKLLAENDSGFFDLGIQKSSAQLGFPSMQNLDQFSPPFMPNLVESPLLPSKHGTENNSEASGSLLNFNQMQTVDIDCLSWPYYYRDNLRIEARPGNSFEQEMEGIYRSSLEQGMEGIYRSSLEQGMEEIYRSSPQYNWLSDLQYF
ncbi:hypothetical protein SUGI_0998410 [Cryptomeria japonica]|uniref:transcription factor MYB7 n=1 Tax=Cryptomeria japonica TaxID=3369 RepID=UPI0024149621|nr:transcription factor MYB7 [Cryptomeria japonica]GLJ47280.1 hypothetical protein SUGI_0998410 [Cryptomeria japonica]